MTSSKLSRPLLALSLSVFLAAPAWAAKPDLSGRRLADRILTASDPQRAALPPKAVEMSIRRHGIQRTALRGDFAKNHTNTYSHELPATPIRDQKQSGRCWNFTALNVVEREYQVRTGQSVKLSRAYGNAKNLQHTAYELLHDGADVTNLRFIANHDIGEGGHFNWSLDIIQRYGAVPERVMRDFKDSTASATAIKLLETVVATGQERLRRIDKHTPEGLAIVKQTQAQIDRIIARAFTGKDKLPDEFRVGKETYTPKSYAQKVLGSKAADYVTLQDSRNSRKGWMKVGQGLHSFEAYNTGDVETMKDAVRAAIDQGQKVYVSAPVGDAGAPFMTPAKPAAGTAPSIPGLMSISAFDYNAIGIPHPKLSRGVIQLKGLNPSNHAMTIIGYDLGKDGKVVKWKVENSWGKTAGDQGIMHMYDDFFSTFVGVVSVPRTAVAAPLLAKMTTEKGIRAELARLRTPQQ